MKKDWLVLRPEDRQSTVTINVEYDRHLEFRKGIEKNIDC